jgi:hypothetical protein
MAQAPSNTYPPRPPYINTQNTNSNQNTGSNPSAGFMVCWTADGAPVSIYAPFGVCPMGFFSSKPPSGENFSPSDPDETFTPEPDEEDEYVQPPIDYDNIVICHSPCMLYSGSENQQSTSVSVPSGVCPAAYPFYTKPECDIPEDVQGRFDAYQAQIDALLAEIDGARSSEEVRDLTAQLEALKAQLEASEGEEEESVTLGGGGEMYFPPPTPPPPSKQAGFGNIPMWAIVGGVTLVAIIVIMSNKRQQPVVIKG